MNDCSHGRDLNPILCGCQLKSRQSDRGSQIAGGGTDPPPEASWERGLVSGGRCAKHGTLQMNVPGKKRPMRRAAGSGVVAPLPGGSRVDQVEAALRGGILSGGWSGTLPGSRALCQMLGVSAETLARALERLRRAGWVRSPGPRRAY